MSSRGRKALRIYGGTFWRCRNKDYLSFPKSLAVRARIRRDLRPILKSNGFTPVRIIFVNYGAGSGPGTLVPLTESTFVLGAWPEQNGSIEFFLHYCGEGKEEGAMQLAKDLRLVLQSRKFTPSPLTFMGPEIFTYV